MSLWRKPNETPAKEQRPTSASNGLKSAKPNGGGVAAELSAEQLHKMASAAKAATATFGEIVSFLMRLTQYKHHSLADLEWLVVPALLSGQFSLATAQSKSKGLTAPVGIVLWASVSEELDKRLSAAPGQPIRLQPQEWKSGDILWVTLAAGDKRVVQGMLKRLKEKEWANKKPAKFFARAKDGKTIVATLEKAA